MHPIGSPDRFPPIGSPADVLLGPSSYNSGFHCIASTFEDSLADPADQKTLIAIYAGLMEYVVEANSKVLKVGCGATFFNMPRGDVALMALWSRARTISTVEDSICSLAASRPPLSSQSASLGS